MRILRRERSTITNHILCINQTVRILSVAEQHIMDVPQLRKHIRHISYHCGGNRRIIRRIRAINHRRIHSQNIRYRLGLFCAPSIRSTSNASIRTRSNRNIFHVIIVLNISHIILIFLILLRQLRIQDFHYLLILVKVHILIRNTGKPPIYIIRLSLRISLRSHKILLSERILIRKRPKTV